MTRSLYAILLLTLMTPASAQDDDWQSWPLGEKLSIAVDALFPNLDTVVRVDASDGTIGTTIDFEQNLGMSDTETLPGINIRWRIARKHTLNLQHFVLDRSGSAITGTQIRFGDIVFDVDLPVSSFMDVDVTSLTYTYSLLFDEKKEMGLSAGLSVQDYKFGITGVGGIGVLEADSGLTAPLPTFGLFGNYAFTDKWIGNAGIGYFGVEVAFSGEEQLSGEILEAHIGIYHKTFEHFRFGLVYAGYTINMGYESAERLSSVDYSYHGPMLSVAAVF